MQLGGKNTSPVQSEREPPVSVEDEKSVRHAVNRAKARQ